MTHRSPDLHAALRLFALAAFATLQREVDNGAEVPFAFEEHDARGRTTFYEFRPLILSFVEGRAERLAEPPDARDALNELAREPAAALFAGSLTGGRTGEDAAFETILLPLVARIADVRGGFDWDDDLYEREYAELERLLFGTERRHVVVVPLIGLEVGAPVDLGGGLQARAFITGELSGPWPESSGLLPERFAREPDRAAVLELTHALAAGATARPDAAAEIADAVTALRLAVGGPVATGPVYFERIDSHPVGVRPSLPIAAAQPPGEPTRLDVFRGGLAVVCASVLPPPTRIRSSARRSTAGSSRSSRPSRSAPSSSGPRSTRCSARATGSGRPRCAPPSSSGRAAASGPSSTRGSSRSPTAAKAPRRRRRSRCPRRGAALRWPARVGGGARRVAPRHTPTSGGRLLSLGAEPAAMTGS